MGSGRGWVGHKGFMGFRPSRMNWRQCIGAKWPASLDAILRDTGSCSRILLSPPAEPTQPHSSSQITAFTQLVWPRSTPIWEHPPSRSAKRAGTAGPCLSECSPLSAARRAWAAPAPAVGLHSERTVRRRLAALIHGSAALRRLTSTLVCRSHSLTVESYEPPASSPSGGRLQSEKIEPDAQAAAGSGSAPNSRRPRASHRCAVASARPRHAQPAARDSRGRRAVAARTGAPGGEPVALGDVNQSLDPVLAGQLADTEPDSLGCSHAEPSAADLRQLPTGRVMLARGGATHGWARGRPMDLARHNRWHDANPWTCAARWSEAVSDSAARWSKIRPRQSACSCDHILMRHQQPAAKKSCTHFRASWTGRAVAGTEARLHLPLIYLAAGGERYIWAMCSKRRAAAWILANCVGIAPCRS